VTSKGRVTIPKEIRDALGWKGGEQIEFRLREGGIVEMSSASASESTGEPNAPFKPLESSS
jgi:AbrB family looped-hinge helix DNA binding protein